MATSYATVADLGFYLRDVPQSANSTFWTSLLDRASRFIDSQTGQFFYQKASAAYLDNGNGERELIFPFPVVSISKLEIAYYTSAPFNVVTSGQYFLFPNTPQDGYPYTTLRLTNIPTEGQSVRFYRGLQNVRYTVVAGWPSVPSQITHLTCKLAARAWKQRDSGFIGTIGNAADGTALTVRALDREDFQILSDFRRPALGIQD